MGSAADENAAKREEVTTTESRGTQRKTIESPPVGDAALRCEAGGEALPKGAAKRWATNLRENRTAAQNRNRKRQQKEELLRKRWAPRRSRNLRSRTSLREADEKTETLGARGHREILYEKKLQGYCIGYEARGPLL